MRKLREETRHLSADDASKRYNFLFDNAIAGGALTIMKVARDTLASMAVSWLLRGHNLTGILSNSNVFYAHKQ
jgi:hypothetical protein